MDERSRLHGCGPGRRPRLREGTELPADPAIAPYLRDGERVLACVQVTLTRVSHGRSLPTPVTGVAYLTDSRLFQPDGEACSIELVDIKELTLSGGHLLLTLRGALGAVLDVESPAEFRALVAAAISARRSGLAQTPSR
jgi:hypothetical protein